jgi:16S rRNA (adenine1518-N6/adenine1519-N6)-dimethyltransferase
MDAAINLPSIQIPALLRKHHLSPHKGLGQNFLIDDRYLQQIVQSAEITHEDTVLEVGAGAGSLTRWLAQSARRVVAVELDIQLIPLLKEVIGEGSHIQIVAGDILQLDPSKLMGADGYVVVANIPYYITSALFRHLLEAPLKPRRMVITVQQEVAERICAEPGALSLLALSVQVYGTPRMILDIPASAFFPSPKVNSTTLRVDLYPQPLIASDQLNTFFKLSKAGFSQKRKMLHNTLAAGLGWPKDKVDRLLEQARIDPQRRAQTLNMDEWRSLTEIVQSLNE